MEMCIVLPKSKLPWHWANGYDDLEEAHRAYDEDEDPEHTNEYGEFQIDKYIDCQLLDADNKPIIPIRIDHYEPIWDTHEDGDPPCKQDREFMMIAVNNHLDMVTVLNIFMAATVNAQTSGTAPEFTPQEETKIQALFHKLEREHNAQVL
jgi:hypothetical protein